jgi:hypothetical protein
MLNGSRHCEEIIESAEYREKLIELLEKYYDTGFTGSIQINFKDGKAMDIQEIKRTKL